MSSGKSKIRTFLSKQGFYLLMIGCVGVIGITALVGGLTGDKEQGTQLQAETIAPARTVQPANNNEVIIAPSEAPVQSDEVETLQLTRPVAGEIVRPYAMDSLVYSQTLKHWETHSGVDIKAEEGAGVVAAMDGTVVSVTQDALMGSTVTISHGENAQTVYASLKSVAVKAEDEVVAGQSIGTVGSTAAGEVADGAHLHFEYKVAGKYLDPATYFIGK